MTTVRLAVTWNRQAMRLSFRDKTLKPHMLCSFPYLKDWIETRDYVTYQDWVMDSGAFSVHNSGATINLNQYIDTAKLLLKQDPFLTEVYSLDVHGDAKQTLKNTEAMWAAGVRAIPTFHMGEPEWALKAMAQYPKVALGGIARNGEGKKRWHWVEQCFARLWPKRVHGFGLALEEAVMTVPWHSVDASSWVQPLAFGNFRISTQRATKWRWKPTRQQWDMSNEVRYYLNLQAKARSKWAKEMRELDGLPAVL